jgi:hypothetical protein
MANTPPVERNNDPSHPAPIPMQRPASRAKMHRQHKRPRAPFLPKDHILTKHRLKPE